MVVFEDRKDVEDWLAPMEYTDFWEAIAPYAVFSLGTREHCDDCITKRRVPQDLILTCLKGAAQDALAEKLRLSFRIYDPLDRQYLLSTH